jgi:hypothetical protein
MFPFGLLKRSSKDDPLAFYLSVAVSLLVMFILRAQGLRLFSSEATGILLSAIALYIGTFTAFLGLLFSMVAAPLSDIVSPDWYQKRLTGIQMTIRNTSVSVVLILGAVPFIALSQPGVALNCNGALWAAGCNWANKYALAMTFEIAVFLLSFVFFTTLLILRRMHTLAMVAVDERRKSIRAYGDKKEAVENSSSEESVSISTIVKVKNLQ